MKGQSALKNEAIRNYTFLKEMYTDFYFPDHLLDKGKAILVDLCFRIENEQPNNLDALYKLTHAATNQFNDLQKEFEENDSELETVARDCIGMDFEFIATSCGFENADVEKLIATREW